MRRTRKTKVVIKSGRDWGDRVTRLASDRGVRRQARKATRSVAHGTRRAQKLGRGRERRRTGKAILGVGVGIAAAGGYAAATKLRGGRGEDD